MTKEAQWEIRELSTNLYNLIIKEVPEWAEFLTQWELGSRR
jgi:hypothetical protein